jgi:hypothetical protein
MKTLLLERIGDLKGQKGDILATLTQRGINNTLTSDIIIHEGNELNKIDTKINELQLMLSQIELYYGSTK